MEQDVYFFGKTAYVTYKFLIDRGLPSSTVYNNTSSKVPPEKRWHSASLPDNKKIKVIDYDSIPRTLVVKYRLPEYNELRSIADLQLQKNRERLSANFSKHVKTILDFEYNSWDELKSLYENKFMSEDKLEMFCKTHALLTKVIELKELGYKLKDLFNLYYQFDNLVFETDNYNSFCNKLKQIKKGKSIEEVLIHGLLNKPSNNLKKDEDVINEIQRLFSEGKKHNAAYILEQVNDYLIRSNRKPISRSSIYNIISQNYIKNVAMIGRHGLKYTENTMLPYSHFDAPTQKGVLWQMDGSRFQFAYKTEKNKYGFLIFFIVMEAFDRKIIGYSWDDSENSIMVKRAIEMSCESLTYLPKEIITDNSPALRSEDMVQIQALFKIWGGYWHKVKKPRDNAYAERYFGVFQESFCKKYDGYLGDGIKSKNLNGKPSPEEIKQYLSTKQLKTRDELIELLHEIIKEYNNSSKRIASCESDYVSSQMNQKKLIEPINLNTIRYSQLFWHSREEKVGHGEVSLVMKKVIYIYQLNDDEELLYRIHGTIVRIRFNPKDMTKVLVFDLKNDEYLLTLEKYRKIPKAMYERDLEDHMELNKNLAKYKSLKKKVIKKVQDIRDKSDQNRAKLPPELIDIGVGTKPECEEAEGIYMSEELEKISKIELHNNKNEEVDFEILFNKLNSKKGSLKVFSYGKN
jgi:hypothetical protein